MQFLNQTLLIGMTADWLICSVGNVVGPALGPFAQKARARGLLKMPGPCSPYSQLRNLSGVSDSGLLSPFTNPLPLSADVI